MNTFNICNIYKAVIDQLIYVINSTCTKGCRIAFAREIKKTNRVYSNNSQTFFLEISLKILNMFIEKMNTTNILHGQDIDNTFTVLDTIEIKFKYLANRTDSGQGAEQVLLKKHMMI